MCFTIIPIYFTLGVERFFLYIYIYFCVNVNAFLEKGNRNPPQICGGFLECEAFITSMSTCGINSPTGSNSFKVLNRAVRCLGTELR